MKMHDLGYVRPNPSIAEPAKNGKTTVYPSSTMNDKTCPFLEGLSIGDTVKMVLECKVTGIRQHEDWDDIENANYFTLDLVKAGVNEKE